MKTLPPIFPLLIAYLLTACTDSPKGLYHWEKAFEENGVKARVRVRSFSRLDVGVGTGGHFVIVPTVGVDIGYEMYMYIEGCDQMGLMAVGTEERYDSTRLEEVLTHFNYEVAPEGDRLAWWMEGMDSTKHILHIIEGGRPFMGRLYQERFVVEKEMNWQEVMSAMDLLCHKVADGNGDYTYNMFWEMLHADQNNNFWRLVDNAPSTECLDQALLDTWPESAGAYSLIRERLGSEDDFSDEWKEKALQMAWELRKEEVYARKMVIALGDQQAIDEMDWEILSQWPEKSPEAYTILKRYKPKVSAKLKKQFIDLNRELILGVQHDPSKHWEKLLAEAKSLEAAAKMADFLAQDDDWAEAAHKMVPYWPDTDQTDEFLSKHYRKLSKKDQERILAQAEQFLEGYDEENDRYLRFYVRGMLEDFADCGRFKRLQKQHPDILDRKLKRCESNVEK